jgi:hypothetical protein
MSETFDYHFKCLDEKNYSLIMTSKVNNRIMKLVFEKTKMKLKKEKNLHIDALGLQDKIEVDRFYFNIIKTAVNKQLKTISKDIKEDLINVLSCDLDRCFFNKNKDHTWTLTMEFKGFFAEVNRMKINQRVIIIAVLMGLLFSGAWFIGGAMVCQNGGGHLNGLSCINYTVVGVCEFNDNLYILNHQNDFNFTYTPYGGD